MWRIAWRRGRPRTHGPILHTNRIYQSQELALLNTGAQWKLQDRAGNSSAKLISLGDMRAASTVAAMHKNDNESRRATSLGSSSFFGSRRAEPEIEAAGRRRNEPKSLRRDDGHVMEGSSGARHAQPLERAFAAQRKSYQMTPLGRERPATVNDTAPWCAIHVVDGDGDLGAAAAWQFHGSLFGVELQSRLCSSIDNKLRRGNVAERELLQRKFVAARFTMSSRMTIRASRQPMKWVSLRESARTAWPIDFAMLRIQREERVGRRTIGAALRGEELNKNRLTLGAAAADWVCGLTMAKSNQS